MYSSSNNSEASLDYVFSKVVDRSLHILSIFLFLLCCYFVLTEQTLLWVNNNVSFLHFISGIIFFNSWHYYLGFFMTTRLTEVRESFWKFNKNKMMMALFGLIYFIFAYVWLSNKEIWYINLIGILSFRMFAKIHSIRQSSGLWKIFYNKNIQHQNNQSFHMLGYEKISNNLMIFSILFLYFDIVKSLLKLQPSVFDHVVYLGYFSLAICICFNFYYVIKISRPFRTEKFLYFIRQFSGVLSYVDVSTILIFHCLHGLEYMAVGSKMQKNSQTSTAQKKYIWSLMLLFLPIAIMVHHSALFDFDKLSSTLFWLLVADCTIQFLHYTLDYFIFKMRNVKIRAEVGPLLIK